MACLTDGLSGRQVYLQRPAISLIRFGWDLFVNALPENGDNEAEGLNLPPYACQFELFLPQHFLDVFHRQRHAPANQGWLVRSILVQQLSPFHSNLVCAAGMLRDMKVWPVILA